MLNVECLVEINFPFFIRENYFPSLSCDYLIARYIDYIKIIHLYVNKYNISMKNISLQK